MPRAQTGTVSHSLSQVTFALPGDPTSLTGGYIYDAHIVAGLRERGWDIDLLPLGEGFPFPDAQTIGQASLLLRAAASKGPVIVDGLALGVLPNAATEIAAISPLIALVHHPLALENGLSTEASIRLRDSERQALAHAACIVTTSMTTAEIVERDYGVARSKLLTAKPGVRLPHGRHHRNRSIGPLRLLSVAAITPRKGFAYLVDALATVADLDWRLTIVGDQTRHRHESADLNARIARLGLSPRINMRGAVTEAELDRLYCNADAFVLASLYEGYGMAYAEAIAHGLPVIGTTGGAIAETVPRDAAILVPPGDVTALSMALRHLLTDQPKRRAMSEAAWAVAHLLPSWEQAVTVFEDALHRLQGRA